MVLPVLCSLLVGGILAWGIATRFRFGMGFLQAPMCLPRLYLHTTHVKVDASQIGQVIPINDHLKFIRHASGRTAYLPILRPPQPRPPMPKALRALLLTFFSL